MAKAKTEKPESPETVTQASEPETTPNVADTSELVTPDGTNVTASVLPAPGAPASEDEPPPYSANLKGHPALKALAVACYEQLAAEHPGGSFPPFAELRELTQQNYVDGAAHLLATNEPRTRFEEIVKEQLSFSA